MRDFLSEEKNSYVFDGFCERPYQEDRDGWRNELPTEYEFPAITQAYETIAMFEEIKRLRKKNWTLEQEVARWKKSSPFSFDKE